MGPIFEIAIYAIPVIIAITLHEAAHGFIARYFGDDTAANAGRVTLNPLKHMDLFGTILLPAFLLLSKAGFVFGYAKPVPVNFAALRSPKRDMVWVAAAGPGMNILIALISAGVLGLASHLGSAPKWLSQLLWTSVEINLVLGERNLGFVPRCLSEEKIMQRDFIIGRCARGEATFQRQQSPRMASLEWADAGGWAKRQFVWASSWLAAGFLALTLVGAWR